MKYGCLATEPKDVHPFIRPSLPRAPRAQTHTYTHVHSLTHAHISTFTHAHAHTRTHTHAHTHMHTQTHARAHTHTQRATRVPQRATRDHSESGARRPGVNQDGEITPHAGTTRAEALRSKGREAGAAISKRHSGPSEQTPPSAHLSE